MQTPLMQLTQRLILTYLCLPFVLAHGQTSQEYAVMGRSAWAAFECTALASHLRETKEQERLFLFGYKQGQVFLGALQSGKIANKDVNGQVPISLVLLLQGPTPDFILGRVFEAAQDNALKKVLKTDDKMNPAEIQKIMAKNEFSNKNCQFIGNAK